jgi:hypothetical protein
MMTINRKEQELIDEVIQNFDFYKCQLMMEYMGWRWMRHDGYRIPTKYDLIEDAKDRIQSAIEGIKEAGRMGLNESYGSSSGGLKATVYKNRYNQITFIKLEFILTEWDAGDD